MRYYHVWGGAYLPFLCSQLHHHLLLAATNRRYASGLNLVVALVGEIALACQIQMTRCFPPTLNQHWGGLPRQRLHQPCWREQPLLVAL
jgi:hypothetical protein